MYGTKHDGELVLPDQLKFVLDKQITASLEEIAATFPGLMPKENVQKYYDHYMEVGRTAYAKLLQDHIGSYSGELTQLGEYHYFDQVAEKINSELSALNLDMHKRAYNGKIDS